MKGNRMKKADIKYRLLKGMLALVLGLGIFAWAAVSDSFVSYAESQAKVTAPKGANIRKEASTSSAAVGGAENGKVLTIISPVQGGDGKTWYQVKSGDITGYIRSDLVEVLEGSVPSEGEEGGGGTTIPPAEVTAVNPVSAAVSSESGKIRDNASSEGQILAEVPVDTALTVTGQATDADGRTWYQVSCLSGEEQVSGFIRYDYVTLAGELTPMTENPPEQDVPEPSPEPEPEKKLFETLIQDNAWLLVDNRGDEPKAYEIQKLFDGVTKNGDLLKESEKTVKNQKVIIIILVFLLVAAAAGIAFLVFKIRDMMDSAYFNEVEKETIRKRKAAPARSDRMQEGERPASRPSGARPNGYGQRPAGQSQGERGSSQGQRPVGSGQRPAGASQGQRPAGQRPAGTAQGPGQRPAGASQRPAGTVQGQRPVREGQPRPAGSQGVRTMATGAVQGPGSSQGPRPVGAQQGARRPAGASQGPRPADASQRNGAPQSGRPVRQAPSGVQKPQPRNFMADDDDDFEHEFLNYDE